MSLESSDVPTQILGPVVQRLPAEGAHARNQLLVHTQARLRKLADWQLGTDHAGHRSEQTEELLRAATLRLSQALEGSDPRDVQRLWALSSAIIRRELIDLERRCWESQGESHHRARRAPGDARAADPVVQTRPSDACCSDHSTQWAVFHQQVERLPAELREVVDLLWYQGLEQEAAAELLGISGQTVRRRWRAARIALVDCTVPAV